MHLKAQVRCLSKRKSLLVGSFVVDCRWSKGSLIQFLLGINTLMNSFRNVFLLFKKNFTKGIRVQRAKLWKEMTIIFPIHFYREQKNFGICRMCITERCQNWNVIGTSDKGEAAMRDQFRERQARVSTADGRFIVTAAGGKEPEKGETRPQKRLETWLDRDTCPTVEGGFYSPGLWCVIVLPVLSWASTLSACAALFCAARGQVNKRGKIMKKRGG